MRPDISEHFIKGFLAPQDESETRQLQTMRSSNAKLEKRGRTKMWNNNKNSILEIQLNKLRLLLKILRRRNGPTKLTIGTTQKGRKGLRICFLSGPNVFALTLFQCYSVRTKIIRGAPRTVGYICHKLLSIKSQTPTIFINIGPSVQ